MPIASAQALPKTPEVPCLARWLSQPMVHPRFATGIGTISLLTLAGGAPLGAEYLLLLVVVAFCTLPHSLPPAARAWCRTTQLAQGDLARARGAVIDPPIAKPTPALTGTAPTHRGTVTWMAPKQGGTADAPLNPGQRSIGNERLADAWQQWVAQAEWALVAGRGSDYRYALYRLGLVADRSADRKLLASVKRFSQYQFATEAAPEAQRWLLLQLRRLDAERLASDPV